MTTSKYSHSLKNIQIIDDKTSQNISSYILGYLFFAISKKKKIAIINSKESYKQSCKIFYALENFSLIKEFVRRFPGMYIVVYTQKNDTTYIKSYLPSVEYLTTDENRVVSELPSFDIVLGNNPDIKIFEELNKITKSLVYIDISQSKELQNKSSFKITQKTQDNLLTKKNIIDISSREEGEFYLLGEVIKNFIDKKRLNLIWIENFSKSKISTQCLSALKNLPNSRFYGKLDYAVFNSQNPLELEDAAKIIETASKKYTLLYIGGIEEIGNENYIEDILKKSNAPLVILNKNEIKNISLISYKRIDIY